MILLSSIILFCVESPGTHLVQRLRRRSESPAPFVGSHGCGVVLNIVLLEKGVDPAHETEGVGTHRDRNGIARVADLAELEADRRRRLLEHVLAVNLVTADELDLLEFVSEG